MYHSVCFKGGKLIQLLKLLNYRVKVMKYASESSMFRAGSSTMISVQGDAQMATGFLGL